MKTNYTRKLPHINPIGATFFVTFRLKNSIPKIKLEKLKEEYHRKAELCKRIDIEGERNAKLFDLRKQHFVKYDTLLNKIKEGPHYLKQEACMKIIAKQMHRFDSELYKLLCFSIMSNHVHMLIETNVSEEVGEVLQFKSDLFNNHNHLSYILQRIKEHRLSTLIMN